MIAFSALIPLVLMPFLMAIIFRAACAIFNKLAPKTPSPDSSFASKAFTDSSASPVDRRDETEVPLAVDDANPYAPLATDSTLLLDEREFNNKAVRVPPFLLTVGVCFLVTFITSVATAFAARIADVGMFRLLYMAIPLLTYTLTIKLFLKTTIVKSMLIMLLCLAISVLLGLAIFAVFWLGLWGLSMARS